MGEGKAVKGEAAGIPREPSEMVLIGSLVYFGIFLVERLQAPLRKAVLTAWLVDYSDGFTKRGLLGAITTTFFNSETALLSIDFTCKGVFLTILYCYIVNIIKYRRCNYSCAILIVSPALIMFPLYDPWALGRMEYFGFIITAINSYLIRQYFTSHAGLVVQKALYNSMRQFLLPTALLMPPIALALMMFLHEGMMLLVVPINFILTFLLVFNSFAHQKAWRSMGVAFMLYVPVWASYIALSLFGASGYEHAFKLCSNIKRLFPNVITYPCTKSKSIVFVYQETIYDNFAFTFDWIKDAFAPHLVFVGLGIVVSMITIIATFRIINEMFSANTASVIETDCDLCNVALTDSQISRTESEDENNTLVLKYGYSIITYFFSIPLLFIVPLFAVGIDWGRWFFIVNMQFVIVFFIFANGGLFASLCYPMPEFQTMEKAFHRFMLGTNRIKMLPLTILLLGLQLPHAWRGWEAFLSPPIFNLMGYLSHIFRG